MMTVTLKNSSVSGLRMDFFQISGNSLCERMEVCVHVFIPFMAISTALF